MLVSQVAHMVLVDITANEPSHRAADKNVGREVFLRRHARHADQRRKAISHDANHRLVVVFVTDQRSDGPYLNGVTRGKGRAAAPKFSRLALIGTVTAKDFFQDARDDQRIEQRFGAKDSDFTGLGVIGDNAESVIASD